MSFLQPWLLAALPLVALPVIIHLVNQRRFQTINWGAMMFLLAARRLSRGYSRLRQWLILAFRMAAIAGLVVAVSRPLASGWVGLAAGGRPDTTIVLVDRSPSMQQRDRATGRSKLRSRPAAIDPGAGDLGLESLGAHRQRHARAPRARFARGVGRRADGRAGQRVGRFAADAASGSRLHSRQPTGPHRYLDLLRSARKRLDRRQQSLVDAAGCVCRVSAGRAISIAGLSANSRPTISRSA